VRDGIDVVLEPLFLDRELAQELLCLSILDERTPCLGLLVDGRVSGAFAHHVLNHPDEFNGYLPLWRETLPTHKVFTHNNISFEEHRELLRKVVVVVILLNGIGIGKCPTKKDSDAHADAWIEGDQC
jgi:hypothetical protein